MQFYLLPSLSMSDRFAQLVDLLQCTCFLFVQGKNFQKLCMYSNKTVHHSRPRCDELGNFWYKTLDQIHGRIIVSEKLGRNIVPWLAVYGALLWLVVLCLIRMFLVFNFLIDLELYIL